MAVRKTRFLSVVYRDSALSFLCSEGILTAYIVLYDTVSAYLPQKLAYPSVSVLSLSDASDMSEEEFACRRLDMC
jgi:hypothetical protein